MAAFVSAMLYRIFSTLQLEVGNSVLSTLAILVWIMNIVVDTVGHMAFKSAAITEHESEWHRWKKMLSSIPLWVGIVCFCLEFVLWLVLLSILPLSSGVLLGTINMVAIMVAGRLLFRELLDPMRVLGMIFIILGVVLVGVYA
jgi:multidrug transporter EmrE-like cation transporter